MIKRLDITQLRGETDPALQKYINRKIGGLDRYLPRQARASAHAEVRLKDAKSSHGPQTTCEITLHVPDQILNVSETTVNSYAAIDIVEVKLKQQIRRYKELKSATSLRHRLTRHFRRNAAVTTEA